MREISAEFFVFQQDSAPAAFCNERHRLSFHQTCRSQKSRSNTVDYKIWGEMQQRLIYQTKVNDVDELKQCIVCLACALKQSVINDTINEWRKRLRACIRAKGGH